jgi:hypothetical protein
MWCGVLRPLRLGTPGQAVALQEGRNANEATAPARLPFPPGPSLHGRMGTDGDEDFLCFGRPDAVALAQWMDKLEAFKHAYERGK